MLNKGEKILLNILSNNFKKIEKIVVTAKIERFRSYSNGPIFIVNSYINIS